MHNATTKQRLAALRRRLGIFTGAPRWVRERRERLAREREAGLRPGRTTIPAYLAAVMTSPFTPTPAPVFAASSVTSFHPSPGDSSTYGETAVATSGSSSMTTPSASGTSSSVQEAGTSVTPGGAPLAATETRTLDLTKQPDAAALWDVPTTRADAPTSTRRSWRMPAAVAALLLLLGAGAFLAFRSSTRSADATPPAAATAEPSPQPSPVDATAAAPAAPERPAAFAGARVEVRRGDTLWDLAAQHLGNPLRWPQVHQANRAAIADPDLIFPGQRLSIPAPSPAAL